MEEERKFIHTGEEVIAEVRAECSRCMLSFSMGKDAMGAYLAIRDKFDEVVPYYKYLVPGLEFVDESLDYYERRLFGGQHIYRLPHPSLIRLLNEFVFQPPERCAVIERLELYEHDYGDVAAAVREAAGLPPNAMTATGVRAADSPNRYRHFKTRGAINRKGLVFAPVFDWNKERLLAAIKKSGVRLPVDYRLFGRTFDGIDLRFLYPIKQHFPRDYQRILEWFPLADMELFRYERRLQA